ncbi:MAG: LamG domain-containing protein [Candidatus Poribacteria bacterium]|nr:LamG domain-containing protein [Candidatus Poribacteria bacterium]
MQYIYSKLSLILVITMVLVILSVMSTHAAVDKHTVAVWLFEEGDGKTVRDASGNGHNGKITGSLKWVKAKSGTGLEFPGDGSGYIVVDSTKKLELETLTIEVLVKVTGHDGKWQGIVCKQQVGCTNRNYGIWVHNNEQVLHAQIGANGGCAFNMNGTTRITDNTWHHLAFTFDGDMGRLYVDGQLETEKANAATFQSNDPITIGVPNIDNANGLIGIIEEIRISNIARSEDEIKEAKDIGLAQILSVDPQSKLTTRWGYIKQVP